MMQWLTRALALLLNQKQLPCSCCWSQHAPCGYRAALGPEQLHSMRRARWLCHAPDATDGVHIVVIDQFSVCLIRRTPWIKSNHLERSQLCLCAVHLAAKLLEDVRPLPLLQHMLQTIFQSTVTRQQTEALEAQCLRALDWRLGPFFND